MWELFFIFRTPEQLKCLGSITFISDLGANIAESEDVIANKKVLFLMLLKTN